MAFFWGELVATHLIMDLDQAELKQEDEKNTVEGDYSLQDLNAS